MPEILMRVTGHNFVAGAVWRQTATGYRLHRCAPILRRHISGAHPLVCAKAFRALQGWDVEILGAANV